MNALHALNLCACAITSLVFVRLAKNDFRNRQVFWGYVASCVSALFAGGGIINLIRLLP